MYKRINETNYWVDIQGEGPPVLFLHGFTGTLHTWDSVIKTLSTNFTCIRVDLPGHGMTETTRSFTMESVCEDLQLLVQELSVPSVHVVGYSMGGRTAISFAMLYPHVTRSLIVESGSPGLASSHDQLTRQTKDEALATEIEANGVEAFVNYWEKLPMFDSQNQLPKSSQEAIREERLGHTAQGLALSLRGMGTGVQPSWWNKLSVYSKPVLLVTGEKDSKFCEIAKQMKNELQHATHYQISEVGHAIHVEESQIFGKIVEDFIFESEES